VDDESGVLEPAKIFLEKENEGLEIETAVSAENGLKLLKEKEIDIIVSDYGMPKTDGIEFLKIIKEDLNLKIPFIMITGKGKEEVAMKALNLGADKYLQKIENPKEQYKILSDVILDLKEEKEREKELKQKEWYLEHIPLFVQVLDEDMNITYRNRNPLRENTLSESEIKNSNSLEFVHPEDRDKVVKIFRKALENPGKIYKDKLRGKTKDGWTWFEGSVINFLDKPEIEGLVVIGQDITKRKKAEEREKFLHSMLRHDIRNKTQVIQSYQSMLKDYNLPEEAEKYLENANNAAENIINLIEKIRALRNIEKENETKKINIGSEIENTIKENIVSELNKNIEIENLDFEVEAGPLIEQVFLNIVENSFKHCDCEKVRISGKETDGKLIVSVEDDGGGIADNEKEQIFERGYKSGETGGTGLGLFLSKEIVESYGGKIEVKDSELGGAKFDVYLNEE